MPKRRLDQLLVDRELVDDLREAKARVMAGEVIVGEHRADKSGVLVSVDSPIRIRGRKKHPFVSRGGLKLAHALTEFMIDPTGMVALDLGASTGGFTDCLVQRGADRVYAVDVGYGLLDWSLRQHHRVCNLERTHAKDLDHQSIPEPIDILVADISFNSLTRLLPPVIPLLSDSAIIIVLIKPQFEARRDEVDSGGIVRDPAVHARVCDTIRRSVDALGAAVLGVIQSPILGGHGNVEFLLAARLSGRVELLPGGQPEQ